MSERIDNSNIAVVLFAVHEKGRSEIVPSFGVLCAVSVGVTGRGRIEGFRGRSGRVEDLPSKSHWIAPVEKSH